MAILEGVRSDDIVGVPSFPGKGAGPHTSYSGRNAREASLDPAHEYHEQGH